MRNLRVGILFAVLGLSFAISDFTFAQGGMDRTTALRTIASTRPQCTWTESGVAHFDHAESGNVLVPYSRLTAELLKSFGSTQLTVTGEFDPPYGDGCILISSPYEQNREIFDRTMSALISLGVRCKNGCESAARPAPQQVPAASNTTNKPSFDCTKAKTASARLICADNELAALDRQMGLAFQKKKNQTTSPQPLVAEQVGWIRERNRKCDLLQKDEVAIEALKNSKPCMIAAFKERMVALSIERPSASERTPSSPLQAQNNVAQCEADFRSKIANGDLPSDADRSGYLKFCVSTPAALSTSPASSPQPVSSSNERVFKNIRGMAQCDLSVGAQTDVVRQFAGPTLIRVALKLETVDQSILMDDQLLKKMLQYQRNAARDFCKGQLQGKEPPGDIILGILDQFWYAQFENSIHFQSSALSSNHFSAWAPAGGDWIITSNKFRADAVVSDNLQRQQRQFAQEAALREQRAGEQLREAARQRQIADDRARSEAKRDLDRGIDILPGIWESQNITLTITKQGSLYLVEARNRGGVVNGSFAGPLRDSQIQLGGAFGNVSVLTDSAELIFATERFVRRSRP